MHSSAAMLIAAIEANILDQARFGASVSPHVELHDEPDVLWTASQVPHPLLNRVYRALFSPEEVDRGIETVLSEYRSRGLPLTWLVGPSSTPPSLGHRLEAAGLSRLDDEVGMAMELSELPEDITVDAGLRIEAVDGVEKLRLWAGVAGLGFGLPDEVAALLFDVHHAAGFGQGVPWRLYLGSLHAEAVGVCRLFLSAGAAGIYHLATVPEARRKGVGTALTLEALRVSRGMGYSVAVLRAAQKALGIYRRLGFREYCTFGRYLWKGESP